MKKILLLIVVVSFLFCNRNEEYVKNVFDKKGNLIQTFIYNNPNDTSNYILKEYFENGNIESIIPYSDNKIHGILKIYYPDGKLRSKRRFQNGIIHGVTYEYGEYKGFLRKEKLFIDGEQTINAQYGTVMNEDTLFGVTYYYPLKSVEDTSLFYVGSIIWGKDGEIIPNMLTYYEVEAKDTIKQGESYDIDLKFHMGLYDYFSLELEIGEMDKDFNFINRKEVQKFTSDSMFISLSINDYEIGSNILLGKIRLLENEVDITKRFLHHPYINEYIFYHQFEVIK